MTAGTPDEIGRRESSFLAPHAHRAEASRGRTHDERPHALRTAFQRDKDRIVHSQAFRRLEYKTQVFVTGNCDHFRTRLTHTIEVAGITRTIARALWLNEDLAEAIALGHDLGHPPFGHCGERALNELLADVGGFDHNLQALRVIDYLEEKYPEFAGLNLTWEVRSGLVKHRRPDSRLDGELLPRQPALEAQIADVADDLTYYAHDLDDGILAGLITVDDLQQLEFWRLVGDHAHRGDIDPNNERHVPMMIRNSIDLLVADLIATSNQRIAAAHLQTPQDAQQLSAPLITFSPVIERASDELRQFLFEHMYWHPEVLEDNHRAVDWMRQLFQYFLAHPDDLGRRSRRRLEQDGLKTTVGDYIAMMTDRYAIEQYQEFIGGRSSAPA